MTNAKKAAEFEVDDDPRVVEAREARERAERRRDDALEALLEAEEDLDASEEAEAEGEGDPAHRRRLVEKLPGVKSDLRVAEKALEAARKREQDALRETVEDLREDMIARVGDRAREFHRRIKAATEANERLREEQERIKKLFHRADVEGTMSQLWWPQLVIEPWSLQGDTKIWAWERFILENTSIELEDPLVLDAASAGYSESAR